MGILNLLKRKTICDNVTNKHVNSIKKRHLEFLIQQNNELGSRLHTLYEWMVDCNNLDEISDMNNEINEILRESERLMKRIERLKELQ